MLLKERIDKVRILILKILGLFKRLRSAAAPGPAAWKGAAFGVAAAGVLLWIIGCVENFLLVDYGFAGFLLSIIIGLFVFSAASGVVVLFLKIQAGIPYYYRWLWITVILITVIVFISTFITGVIITAFAGMFIVSIFGAALNIILRPGYRNRPLIKRIITISGLVIGALGLILGSFYLLYPGSVVDKPVNAAAGIEVEKINAPDPSQAGAYKVLSLSYGSGEDYRRKQYGEDADIVTKTVDGTPYIDGWEGFIGWARTLFWKFDVTELPLNASVWYPDGDGPYPLVLAVHGNHLMEDYSDSGYAYLGELLASNGFIFASVDENFLNYSWSNILGGIKEENDARGWILLEHLKLWRKWNNSLDGFFSGKVDMNNIGLIGHSRGGEAAAVAAAFNMLSFYPDDARQVFDYGFNIKSVIAIAPTDGMYKPTGVGTPIEDISYLVLHGANDGDLVMFIGASQYERVSFTGQEDKFKASVYIYGANHGQFNTEWGNRDVPIIASTLLNKKEIMPPQEQRQIAKVYIPAFLRATLRGETGYIPLFKDYRTASGWLPDTIYLNNFQDSATTIISDFEEDIDLVSTSIKGGRLMGENLSLWKEDVVELKVGTYEAKSVFLGWDNENNMVEASYLIELPDDGFMVNKESCLVFSLSDANDENEDARRESIDLTIELADASGVRARLPLSSFSRLQPQIEGPTAKADFMYSTKLSEPVFQTFEYPLEKFVNNNAEFDSGTLESIRFIFDKTPSGVVILDNIGFRP
ncbi:MAG: hypothetical protein JEZ04_19135 [Spirochaetales bacterium]|nr:hypothetical protein [Spirochaetales bacterium]